MTGKIDIHVQTKFREMIFRGTVARVSEIIDMHIRTLTPDDLARYGFRTYDQIKRVARLSCRAEWVGSTEICYITDAFWTFPPLAVTLPKLQRVI